MLKFLWMLSDTKYCIPLRLVVDIILFVSCIPVAIHTTVCGTGRVCGHLLPQSTQCSVATLPGQCVYLATDVMAKW